MYLEDIDGGRHEDLILRIAGESDPGKAIELLDRLIEADGLDRHDHMVAEYVDLALLEGDNQAYFRDGDETLDGIYVGMIRDQYCWIAFLDMFGADVFRHIAGLLEALDGHSDDPDCGDAMMEIASRIRRDIPEGDPAAMFYPD